VGGVVQAGATVLTGTSPVPVVGAALPVSQEYLVKAGDQVTVTLPDGTTTTPGVVASISSTASSAGGGSSPDGSSPGSSGSSGGGSGNQPTVQMIVRLAHPAAAGHLDQAPVEVGITSAQASGVLAVPVNALVALAGGGYAVEVVQGSARHLVAVQTGLFTSTLVQVTGTGLSPGTAVEVPAQ
jgi:protein involved in polysaccharide export with SLBB domain